VLRADRVRVLTARRPDRVHRVRARQADRPAVAAEVHAQAEVREEDKLILNDNFT
jgi:hypothetical protein